MNQIFSLDEDLEEMDTKSEIVTPETDTCKPDTRKPDTCKPDTCNPDTRKPDTRKPIKKKSYNSVMAELLKPPPKEDKPNIHLSGGGQFSKLDKI